MAGRALPTSVVRKLFVRATGGMGVGLCLHRVGKPREGVDPRLDITIPSETLDEFLETFCQPDPDGGPAPVVTLAFDDGYADAVEYVASRAKRYPHVEWLVFVCPEKLEKRAGFRWDLYETLQNDGVATGPVHELILGGAADVSAENDQEELKRLTRRPEFALATVERCRALLELPNVKLGNHTNSHLRLSALPLAAAARDLAESTADFEALFGKCEQFAFPFGVPGVHWTEEHAEVLRRSGVVQMWSTEERPYELQERAPGQVLPRLVFPGRYSAKTMALWITWRAIKTRARRAELPGLDRPLLAPAPGPVR